MLPNVDQLLASLVNIRSVNPALPRAEPGDSEANAANFVAEVLTSHGIEARMQEALPGRPNVIAHIPRGPLADQKVILLSAHMDTYPASMPDGTEYQAKFEGGYLFGRGSADAKGSLAAMLHALLATRASQLRRETYFVASVDEEYGLCGCRAVAAAGLRADLAITGEPTSLEPIVAQKGIVRSHVHVLGDIAHAAYPQGANALYVVGDVLEVFNAFNRELQGVFSKCGLTPMTITPTRIESDGDMNKTPSRVSISFDARTLPSISQHAMLRRLREQLTQKLEGRAHFVIDEPYFVSPANQCDPQHPMVAEFLVKSARAGGRGEAGTFSYGSEAGYLSAIADAALVYGPGDAKYSHGPGERIALAELATAARVFADVLIAPQR